MALKHSSVRRKIWGAELFFTGVVSGTLKGEAIKEYWDPELNYIFPFPWGIVSSQEHPGSSQKPHMAFMNKQQNPKRCLNKHMDEDLQNRLGAMTNNPI